MLCFQGSISWLGYLPVSYTHLIATILASNNINIKNIGIVHNREFEEGVLRIEFYQEPACTKAAALLQKYRYIVYEV